MTLHGSPAPGKSLSSPEPHRVPGSPSIGWDRAGLRADHCGCHPTTWVPVGWCGREPKVPGGARQCLAGWQGQGWLTAGMELRDAGALALRLGGGLAYLPLEGGEEVLAKLFGHVCLQVGLHEEAKALVVDGLGRGQRVMEAPREGVLCPPLISCRVVLSQNHQLPRY